MTRVPVAAEKSIRNAAGDKKGCIAIMQGGMVMGYPAIGGLMFFHQLHSALWTVARFVLHNLWMHRAGILNGLPALLSRLIGRRLGRVFLSGAGAASQGQAGYHSDCRQCCDRYQ